MNQFGLAAIIAGTAVSLLGAAFTNDASRSFGTPSGNIRCMYQPPGDGPQGGFGLPTLACEREKPSTVRIVLGPKGKGEIFQSVTDPFCCSADKIVQYGETWETGPFKCLSARGGLTCRRGDGHGLFMSRTKALSY